MNNYVVKIGFVPSYRRLFDKSFTAWCQKMYDETLAIFREIEGMEIVKPYVLSNDGCRADSMEGFTPFGAVASLDEAETVANYFSKQGIDGLIIGALDFGDERSAAKIAEMLDLPTLLYATKEPHPLSDSTLGRISDSYCGTLAISAALRRRKIPFHFAGIFFPDEADFRAEIRTFVKAVSVTRKVKGCRIGQIGVRPNPFESMGYNESALIQKFGQNVVHCSISDIVLQTEKLSDNDLEVQKIISDTKGNAAEITVAEDYFLKAAKLELALIDFWENNHLSVMALQCWPTIIDAVGINVCAVLSRLTERHLLTACETDVLGALSMLASYSASLGRQLPHFIDWITLHQHRPNYLMAWHCGNAPTSLASNSNMISLRSRNDMRGDLPFHEGDASAGLYQFQLKSGEVTFCRLAEYDNKWKMLIAIGEVVPSTEIKAGTWAYVKVRDHNMLYRTLVEEGFTQHASMIHENQLEVLIQACKFLEIEPVVFS